MEEGTEKTLFLPESPNEDNLEVLEEEGSKIPRMRSEHKTDWKSW